MKFIKDSDKLINIHPLVVYFILPGGEYERYVESVKSINRYSGYTLKIYRYSAVPAGESSSAELNAELAEAISQHNIMVRLVDDVDGCWNYAFESIDLSLSGEMFAIKLRAFILNVCSRNIEQLNTLITHYRRIDQQHRELIDLERMLEAFDDAREIKQFKTLPWNEDETRSIILHNHSIPLMDFARVSDHSIDKVQGMTKAIDHLKSRGLSTASARELAQQVWDIFAERYNVSKSESDKIVKGASDVNSSHYLKDDHNRRLQPVTNNKVRITLKQIPTIRYRKQQMVYGIEITMGQTTTQVYFKIKDSAMLYFATLLCCKSGRQLSKNDLVYYRFKKGAFRQWLKELYEAVYHYDSRDFNDWERKITDGDSHIFDNAKSTCNRQIEEALAECQEAIYYTILNSLRSDSGSYYSLQIDPADISVAEELEFLVSGLKAL